MAKSPFSKSSGAGFQRAGRGALSSVAQGSKQTAAALSALHRRSQEQAEEAETELLHEQQRQVQQQAQLVRGGAAACAAPLSHLGRQAARKGYSLIRKKVLGLQAKEKARTAQAQGIASKSLQTQQKQRRRTDAKATGPPLMSRRFTLRKANRQSSKVTGLFRKAGSSFGFVGRMAQGLADAGEKTEALPSMLQGQVLKASLNGIQQIGRAGLQGTMRALSYLLKRLAKVLAVVFTTALPWLLIIFVIAIVLSSIVGTIAAFLGLAKPASSGLPIRAGHIVIDPSFVCPAQFNYGIKDECTWRVYNAMYQFGIDYQGYNLGNGGDWAARAQDQGYTVSHTAALGRVGCYNSVSGRGWEITAGLRGTSRVYGHVIFCTGINSDGSVNYFEGWAARTPEELPPYGRSADFHNGTLSAEEASRLCWIDFSRDYNAERMGGPPIAPGQDSNALTLWKRLRGDGFSPEAAAAAIGFMQYECHLNPNTHENGGANGYGLMQWMGSRKQELFLFMRENGTAYEILSSPKNQSYEVQSKNLNLQIDFIFKEIYSGNFAYLGFYPDQFKQLRDIEEGIDMWFLYGDCNPHQTEAERLARAKRQRIENARNILATYNH